MESIPPGLHRIRTPIVSSHVLVDENGRVVVIDAGFVGTPRRIQRLFRRLNLEPQAVEAIILTHGHIDHAANTSWLRTWTGAPVYAHPAERAHVAGAYPYRGVARVCGILELLARTVIRYRSAPIDRILADGEILPFWGGLRVVHLPGHTLGHCGFWSEPHQLLFIGDLVAISWYGTVFPPPIFNSAPHLLRASLHKAVEFHPHRVIPNHYARLEPAIMATRFLRFAERHG